MKRTQLYRLVILGSLVLLALLYALDKLPGVDYQRGSELLLGSAMLVFALALCGLAGGVVLHLLRRLRDRRESRDD